eukprot:TRINITY_DN2870_c0_g1_i2.p1 TRINITY_DN2870_c0_g1~~TRINITY_DN2870_c0_g1_i2.p1  ORF type:complete len:599 (-),score=97.31 TRINITY_DN2870_c0_g1_i2:98-1894(-)
MHNSIKIREAKKFDGQKIWVNDQPVYALGSFLGSGVSGLVHESEDCSTRDTLAIKIVNPIGFKLMNLSVTRRCSVLIKGVPIDPYVVAKGSFVGHLREENVSWLYHHNSEQVIAAIADKKGYRELSLSESKSIWGWNAHLIAESFIKADYRNEKIDIPNVPHKYRKFCEARMSIYREIENMSCLHHKNIIRFHEVLELLESSKLTIFLVMEYASGGELFDQLSSTKTDMSIIRSYFAQLVTGIEYCHRQGVCHRDLKPDNLLLSGDFVLKIGDFGLSALFRFPDEDNVDDRKVKTMKSIVGSPHYVAPEIICSNANTGYDGSKADIWSMGVVLYAMIFQSLPFGRDLLTCSRFLCWSQHCNDRANGCKVNDSWFFGCHCDEAEGILRLMLDIDPSRRPTARQLTCHPFIQEVIMKSGNSVMTEPSTASPRTLPTSHNPTTSAAVITSTTSSAASSTTSDPVSISNSNDLVIERLSVTSRTPSSSQASPRSVSSVTSNTMMPNRQNQSANRAFKSLFVDVNSPILPPQNCMADSSTPLPILNLDTSSSGSGVDNNCNDTDCFLLNKEMYFMKINGENKSNEKGKFYIWCINCFFHHHIF